MKKKVFLAILLSALLLALIPSAALAQGNSDEVLLANSLRHYIQALEAYNDGDYSSVPGLLQAASSNAKHVDPELSGLLGELTTLFKSDKGPGRSYSLDVGIASQIAIIYNSVMQDSYPEGIFDPDNPLEGVGGQAGMT